jgi:membrane protease subunit HflK
MARGKGGWQSGGDGGGPWGRPHGSGGGSPPPGETPPGDFDEMLRRGHESLRKMFPGDGGKRSWLLIIAVGVVFWLATGIYFVEPDEQGVEMRFGEFHRMTDPGPNYHLPFPVDSVYTPKVTSINKVEVGFRSYGSSRVGVKSGDNDIPEESLMLTKDENIVDINFQVQWKIRSASDYLFNVRNPDDTVKAVAESAMREVIGQTMVATVLADEEGKQKVALDTKTLIQGTLNTYNAGVEIINVNLLKVDPPSDVIGSFRDVQTARIDYETARNQAEAYRNDILPRARGLSQRMLQESDAYKQQVVADAQGEAARFISVYNEYKLAKDVTKQRIYLDTMGDVLQGMSKMVIDRSGTQAALPYLPLPALQPRPTGEIKK